MNMDFKKLYNYNNFANEKLFSYIDSLSLDYSNRIMILAHHIINAQEIWISRISGAPSSLDVWAIRPESSLIELEKQCKQKFENVIEKMNDEIITYTTSLNQRFSNSVSDILFHIFNHGTNHRGQINTLLRQGGYNPVIVDYIFYVRENLPE